MWFVTKQGSLTTKRRRAVAADERQASARPLHHSGEWRQALGPPPTIERVATGLGQHYDSLRTEAERSRQIGNGTSAYRRF